MRGILYGGCPGHSIGFSLRYQGELLGLCLGPSLKIVIYVENYPQKRCFRLADYHPFSQTFSL